MYIVLPRAKKDVEILVRNLQQFRLSTILNDLKETEVLLDLPKFIIEYDTDVSMPLKNVINYFINFI